MKSKLLYWFGSYFAFLAVAWAVAWFGTEFPQPLTLNSSADDLKRWAGEFGDPSSYLVYADEILKDGPLTSWHPSCFPPGMAAMNIALKAMGMWPKWVFWSQTLSILLWATAFFSIALSFAPAFRPWVSFLLVNSIFFLPSMRDWAFGTGALYSESKAHPFFLMAIACLIWGFRSRRYRAYVASGLLMAICIYFRVYFERMAVFFFGALLASALVGLYHSSFDWKRRGKELVLPAIFFFGICQLVLAPWIIRNRHAMNTYSMAPAQMHITLYHLWEVSSKVPVILGKGANTACLTDPALCTDLHVKYGRVIPDGVMKRNALLTLAKSPLAWYRYRATQFHEFWIGAPYRISNLRELGLFLEGHLCYFFMFGCLAFGITHLFSRQSRLRDFAWISTVFFFFNFVAFSFAGMDIDGRHSIPIRLFAYFSFFWFLGLRKETGGAVLPRIFSFPDKKYLPHR